MGLRADAAVLFVDLLVGRGRVHAPGNTVEQHGAGQAHGAAEVPPIVALLALAGPRVTDSAVVAL